GVLWEIAIFLRNETGKAPRAISRGKKRAFPPFFVTVSLTALPDSVLGHGLGVITAGVDLERLGIAADHALVYHHLGYVVLGRNLVHGVEQGRLHDGPQSPGTGLA